MIRAFLPEDEEAVRRLTTEAHPTWPRSKYWYNAYPTLVAVWRDEIIGHASFTVDMTQALWGLDTVVAPSARRCGVGQELWLARIEIGQDVGAKVCIGTTQDENDPMKHLLLKLGFTEWKRSLAGIHYIKGI